MNDLDGIHWLGEVPFSEIFTTDLDQPVLPSKYKWYLTDKDGNQLYTDCHQIVDNVNMKRTDIILKLIEELDRAFL